MGESASQAMYVAVYVFIFIIALSASIFLFNSITEYAELSYEYGTRLLDNTLIINAPTNKYRIITADQVISYYFNYINKDQYAEGTAEKTSNSYNITIKVGNTVYNDPTNTYKEFVAFLNAQRTKGYNNYVVKYTDETTDGKANIRLEAVDDATANEKL